MASEFSIAGEDLLTTRQVCELLQVSASHLGALRKRGRVRAVQIPGIDKRTLYRYPVGAIEELVPGFKVERTETGALRLREVSSAPDKEAS